MATGVTADGRTTPACLQQNGGPEPAGNDEVDDDAETVLEGEELFMTLSQEERDAWQQMMTDLQDDLKTRKDSFQKWYDRLVSRRMFAYSRMRKLKESIQDRARFYSDVTQYISALEAKVKVRKNRDGVKVSQSKSEVNGQPSSSNTEPQQQQAAG